MKQINNSSWVSPGPDLGVLLALIILTIIIECGLIYAYAKYRKFEHINELLSWIVAINFATGLVGFLIGSLVGI